MRRKVLLVAILILSMLLQCMMPFVPVYAETEAEAEEQDTRAVIALNGNLYKAVKAQLKAQGISAEYKDANGIIIFPEGEIEKVTFLNLSNSEIDDLGNVSDDYPGLDGFTNLQQINLHANYLTKDSHLDVLDSLEKLTKVDLSSNQITSVNSIANFHSGKTTYDITDQRITGRTIIKVNDSEDADNEEKTAKQAIVALPQILLEAEGGFSPSWIWNSNVRLTREIIPYSTDSRPPEIDYDGSFQVITGFEGDVLDYTDGVEGEYPYMLINVAYGEGSSYQALRGLIKFKIEVLDSESVLANTQMTFYYAITGDNETGIAFDDGYLYRAVRDQLTKGQTINTDQTVKDTTDVRNVYDRTYDDALIMVISDDDIINNVPSLVLNDKRITDLRGIEEFVGLESSLNISYNYITSIEKIIELEAKKGEKEEAIREKFSKILADLKTAVSGYDTARSNIKTTAENATKIEEELTKLRNDVAPKQAEQAGKEAELATKQTEIETKQAELETKQTEYNAKVAELNTKSAELEAAVAAGTYSEAEINAMRSLVESLGVQVNTLNDTINNLRSEINTATERVTTLNNEINTLKNSILEINRQIMAKNNEKEENERNHTAATQALARYSEELEKCQKKLYKVFENEYRLVSLLPVDVNYLSYENLMKANEETIKSYAASSMSRISSFESAYALTDYEDWALQKLLTQWGASHGYEFKLTKTVFDDPENPEVGREEPIEFPIANFFSEINGSETLGIRAYEELVYIFKCIDALSQVEQYSLIVRQFEETNGSYAQKAIKEIESLYNEKELDLYFYNLILRNEDGSVKEVSLTADKATGTGVGIELKSTSLYNLDIGLLRTQYSGSVTNHNVQLAHRQALMNDGEIENYIFLPRVKKLNFADNKVRTLEEIDTLTELKELNAWKNMVNDISNVNWEAFTKLKGLNLGYNQISDITPLQVLKDLELLNVSYNLLAGRFSFRLINMRNLRYADFSHNQYSDIQYANDQFILRAMGYDADNDGRAEGYTVPEWLEATGIVISFQYQTTEMETTIVKTNEEFVEFELPLIFRQLEQMDNARTSFGIDSVGGLVEPEGTTVKLRVPNVGEYEATVSVEGRNGYDNNIYYGNGYTTEGIGYGTICKIKYTVVEGSAIPAPVTPTEPETPEEPTDPETPEYGYRVENGYVYVLTPETTVANFTTLLVDEEKYDVTITENRGTNISTSAVVTVTSKDGETVYDIFEVVVKGDLNGDGEVDALDSGEIRKVINDTGVLTGAFAEAADVNSDSDIDSQDAMLILQYRADRITSFED